MRKFIFPRSHFSLRALRGFVFSAPLLAMVSAVYGQVATTTQLTIPVATVAVGVPTLLTATVTDAASHGVHLGTVAFYDGARLLGEAQIVSGTTGAYPQGTANLKTASLLLGANSITAVFSGTKSDLKSASTAKTVTVTGANRTISSLSGNVTSTGSATGADFQLSAGLLAFGAGIPTGSFDFLHVSSGATIGTKPLSGATWTPDFLVSSTPPVFNEAGAGMVAGDFNNDGFLDLVNGAISVVLGNGDGTFQRTVKVETGRSSIYVYSGDFNNDGRLDLAIGSLQDGQVAILLGNGDGTFQAGVNYGTLHDNFDAYVGDVDGDGNLDLVCTNNLHGDNPSVSVLLGNGDGTFRPQQTYPVDSLPDSVRAGDLNGDGIPDLVVSTLRGGSVLLGKGDGTFLPYHAAALNGPAATSTEGPNLALGDVNGDGKLDAVVIAGQAAVSLGRGDGTFEEARTYPVDGGQPLLMDMNQDGKLDIVMGTALGSPSSTVQLLAGNGDGTFQPAVNYVDGYPGTGSLISGDFNGDGEPDLVTSSEEPFEEIVALSGQTAHVLLAKDELGPGTTTVAASYSGDGVFAGSVSNQVLLSNADIDYSGGFAGAEGLQLNGGATVVGDVLELSNGSKNQATSVYSATPVNIQAFVNEFTFQIVNPDADGFTFTIQNAGPTAVGSRGGGLGYKGIAKSVAIKFDIYNNSGEGTDSTGLFLDGAVPTIPSNDLSNTGIKLRSGDAFKAYLTYDGAYLTMTITDTVTLATWTNAWKIDIAATVGGPMAYVGFTGGTGAHTSTETIAAWRYLAETPPPNYPLQFGDATNLNFQGSAAYATYPGELSKVTLTDNGLNEAGSMFYAAPQNVRAFTTDFDFMFSGDAAADGLTFTIQNEGPNALGGSGGGLGYKGISKSVAVKFDIFNNSGEGKNSTGLYVDGAAPEVPAVDLTPSGIDLTIFTDMDNIEGYHIFEGHITYDGTNLTLTITDLTLLEDIFPNTLVTFTHSWPIDIPGAVGGPTAYVGFTAATGGRTSLDILSAWTYLPGTP